ncbi:MAG: tetratricopeptide repeat protein [Syntrophales bacterium]
MTSTPARFILFSFLFLFFIPHHISAETKTFIKEYTYQASEDDSRNSSRVTAMREVKRLLLEELGTYLESITEVKNFQLTKDQITSLTAGIVKAEIVDEKWDGHIYWIKTKILADEGEVIKSIDSLRKNREKSSELEEVRKRSDTILEENKKLREELKLAKGEDKEKVQIKYNKAIKELAAIEQIESAYRNYQKGDFEAAVHDFDKAFEMDPTYQTYTTRGMFHASRGEYNEAIVDFSEAIELNPRDVLAYLFRGKVNGALGKYNEAIVDLSKAIELNPRDVLAYYNRGKTYSLIGDSTRAVQDLSKAIKLHPDARSFADDPAFDNIRNTPEFRQLIGK